MDYFYKVVISGDRELLFRELSLEEYKNLQKMCLDDDLDVFKKFVDNMISGVCLNDCCDLNSIDIYNILLNIRMYSVSDDKSFKTYINGTPGNLKVDIQNIIDLVLDIYSLYSSSDYISVDIDDFGLADSVLVDIFNGNKIKGFVKNGDIYSGFDEDVENLIPISIKNQIDYRIKDVVDIFSEIELFELEDESGLKNTINFNLDGDFIYQICRVFLKDDLKSLYQDIYDLKAHLNIGFNEHKYITVSEMGIYVNLFNKNQEKQNQSQKSKNGNYPI